MNLSRITKILTLAEQLGVSVGEKVDDGSGVGLLAAGVLVADLNGDERPAVELVSIVLGLPGY